MTNPGRKCGRSLAIRTWRRWKRQFASCCSILLLRAIFVSAQAVPSDKGVNFYSLAREVEIGRAGAEEFARRVTVLRGAEVNEYLDKLGRELSAVAPGQRFSYSFVVFRGDAPAPHMAFPGGDAPAVEAITLPGGPIFIPAVLIGRLDSEPELAALLAHAISHIALRHSTRSATRE